MIIISIATIFLLILSIFVVRIYQLNNVSKGQKISNKSIEKALIVLDIQKDTLSIPQYKNSDKLLDNINTTIKKADSLNIPVIYSKQVGNNPVDKLMTGGKYKKDSEGINFSDQLILASDNVFYKTKNDLFSNKEFEEFLLKNSIGDLYIVGADASACVSKTTEAALNRGYKVTLIKDSIFSINHKYLDKVITKYKDKGAIISDVENFN